MSLLRLASRETGLNPVDILGLGNSFGLSTSSGPNKSRLFGITNPSDPITRTFTPQKLLQNQIFNQTALAISPDGKSSTVSVRDLFNQTNASLRPNLTKGIDILSFASLLNQQPTFIDTPKTTDTPASTPTTPNQTDTSTNDTPSTPTPPPDDGLNEPNFPGSTPRPSAPTPQQVAPILEDTAIQQQATAALRATPLGQSANILSDAPTDKQTALSATAPIRKKKLGGR